MKAAPITDLHARRCRLFLDVAAERLFADGEIRGSTLQIEPRARLAKFPKVFGIKLFANGGNGFAGKLLELGEPIRGICTHDDTPSVSRSGRHSSLVRVTWRQVRSIESETAFAVSASTRPNPCPGCSC